MAQTILVETHGRVGLIRLNRPEALNALCDALMDALGAQLAAFDAEPGIGCDRCSPARRRRSRPGPTSREMQDGPDFPDVGARRLVIARRWEGRGPRRASR